jgi:2-oxoacid:acceptor oxidoreductase delta subunit (pyruvate/2-ketoisovalerate family)
MSKHFVIPKEKEVPLGCITPAPVTEQPMMITGNWRIYRPVLDPEKCNLCMSCIIFCPDACWQLNDEEDEPVWNAKYCKGCSICVNECTSGALTRDFELNFEDGVVRLEKPF